MDNYNQYFADKLREYRKNCGFTQAQLAKALNTERSTIAKYETAVSRPNLETIERIARILGIPVMALLPQYQDKSSNEGDRRCDDSVEIYQLRRSERTVLAQYRVLSEEGKEALEAYLSGLCKQESERIKQANPAKKAAAKA